MTTLFQNAKVAILAIDPDNGSIIAANPKAIEFYGQKEEKLKNLNVSDINALTLGEISKEIRAAQSEKRDYFHFKHRVAGGKSKDVKVFTNPGDINGKKCLFSIIVDVSNEIDGEIHNQLMSFAMEQTPSSIFMTDKEGNIQYVNEAFTKITGYSKEEVIGQNPRILKSGESTGDMYAHMWQTIKSGKSWTGLFHNKKKNGQLYWAWNHVSPIMDQNGDVNNFLAVGEDITILRETTEALRKERGLLQSLIDSLDEGVMLLDQKRQVLAFNKAAAEIRGLSEDSILNMEEPNPNVERFWPNGTKQECFKNPVFITLDRGIPQKNCIYGVKKANSSDPLKWLSVNTEPLTDKKEQSGLVISFRDITTQIEASTKMDMVSKVFDHAAEGIMITDASSRIIQINKAFTKITGYVEEEVLGYTPKKLHSGKQGSPFYEEMWKKINNDGEWFGELWNVKKNGSEYAEQLSISTIKNDEGKVTNYIGIFLDITEKKIHEEQVQKLAYFDSLTGLPNRVLLSDRMQQAISRSNRNRTLLAVGYMDLDGFKDINDRFGHNIGDEVLIEVAKRLNKDLRPSDTIARLGGDEFVVLLADVKNSEEIDMVMGRVIVSIAKPIVINNVEMKVSASIGVSVYPGDGADADSLMRNADQAMYVAKQMGRNRVHMFDSTSDKKARELKEIRTRMSEALENNELVLFWQPKVDIQNGTLVGAEALIRWKLPDGSILPPAKFLPSIERDDLMVKIGDWIIEEAFRQLSDWNSRGLVITGAINIASKQIQDRGFLGHLLDVSDQNPDVSPDQIELEIVETTALEDMEVATSMLFECQNVGFKISLDDFGTGYSSLSYFRKLPINIVKIDQSFVRDMLVDNEDKSIVQGILGMSKAFGRSTVAEGIECEAHYDLLRHLGCDCGQGYLIAKPMPAETFFEWAQDPTHISKFHK